MEWLSRRFNSKWFWLLLIWAIVEDVTFFFPVTSVLIWVGLIAPDVFRWVIRILDQYCQDVQPGAGQPPA